MEISAITIMHDDGSEEPAASIAIDAAASSSMNGVVAAKGVNVDGDRAIVVIAYPADDVPGLNTSSLGSAVRNALLSVV